LEHTELAAIPEAANLKSSIFNLQFKDWIRMPTVDELRRRYEDLTKRAGDLRSYL
jgi:hypothetical protein